ncbi:uncharacterized protein LOC143287660 [Babylonia areolata]|uniref:uncharacterized protein LOC143287660 n=1 Tax=Babylonia areolata TaxID=304850 RepID=UPI003FD31E48
MALFVWLICTTLAIMSQGAPAPQCPSRCTSCSNGVAECSRRSLVSPPKGFPSGTRKIIMDGNHVRILGTRSFQNMKALEVLRMKGNKVRVVKKAAFKKLPNLMTLDLSNNQLVKIYSKGFEGLQQLQTLSLQYNKLRSMSRIFDTTPKLYQLNLAFNRLRSIGKNDLRTPTRIHYLDLRNNRISKIHPEAFKHLRLLRYLFLNQNPLVTLPDMKFGSSVLQLIDFSNCRLTHVPRTMPQSISDFRLSDNKIMQINDTDFKNMTKLRMLALNNNELHFVANGAFNDLHSLDEIWLRNNKLVYIPRGLPNHMRKLYMDSNKIREIENGLFSNESRLDYLTVENNRINRINNKTFTGLKFLKSLNFRGNRLKVIETGTFDSLGNLTTLSLSNNPLEKVEDNAFINLENLTFLHLDMGGEKVTLEQNFLPQMPQLKQLSLMSSPGLGKAFVQMVDATPIAPLKMLTEIDLTYNDLNTLSPNIREVFPALNALALDGNSWICDRRLVWLKEWMMSSDVSFSKYEEVICEHPYSLKGQLIRDVNDEDFVEVAPTTQAPSLDDYSRMMAGKESSNASSSSSLPSPAAMRDSAAVIGAKPPPDSPEGSSNQMQKKKKSRKGRKRKQRKARGKGRKKRGKSGKGRKRRNRRNRKARVVSSKSG